MLPLLLFLCIFHSISGFGPPGIRPPTSFVAEQWYPSNLPTVAPPWKEPGADIEKFRSTARVEEEGKQENVTSTMQTVDVNEIRENDIRNATDVISSKEPSSTTTKDTDTITGSHTIVDNVNSAIDANETKIEENNTNSDGVTNVSIDNTTKNDTNLASTNNSDVTDGDTNLLDVVTTTDLEEIVTNSTFSAPIADGNAADPIASDMEDITLNRDVATNETDSIDSSTVEIIDEVNTTTTIAETTQFIDQTTSTLNGTIEQTTAFVDQTTPIGEDNSTNSDQTTQMTSPLDIFAANETENIFDLTPSNDTVIDITKMTIVLDMTDQTTEAANATVDQTTEVSIHTTSTVDQALSSIESTTTIETSTDQTTPTIEQATTATRQTTSLVEQTTIINEESITSSTSTTTSSTSTSSREVTLNVTSSSTSEAPLIVFATTPLVSTTVEAPQCPDLLFVIDSSGNVKSQYEKQKTLVANIVHGLGNHTRTLGLMTYAGRKRQRWNIPIRLHIPTALYLKKLQRARFLSGVTATGAALSTVFQELEQSGRSTTVVLLTDGFSFDSVDEEAEKLRSLPGVDLFVAGDYFPIVREVLNSVIASRRDHFTFGNKGARRLIERLRRC